MAVVVACFGNVLRGDDGFGIEVARRLQAADPPEQVRVLEVGIGGIHLVQQLGDDVEGLLIVDAVELGRPAGTVAVIRPDVLDVAALPPQARRDQLADVHYATPDRALMLARALGLLPPHVLVVGCQPRARDEVGEGLSLQVAGAVEPAVAEVRRALAELGVAW